MEWPNAVRSSGVARSRAEHFLRAAEAGSAERESADIQNIEGDDVAAADFMQQIFLGHQAILKKDRRGGAAVQTHLFFFGAGREAGVAALDDEAGEFFAVDFGEDDVDVGKAAVGDPHLLAVEHPVLAIGREHGARAGSLRVGAGLRLGEAIGGQPFAGGKLRKIFLLLLFGAEINDG